MLEDLLEQASRSRHSRLPPWCSLDRSQVAAAAVDGGTDCTLADVMAADGGVVGQGVGPQRWCCAALRQDQRGGSAGRAIPFWAYRSKVS